MRIALFSINSSQVEPIAQAAAETAVAAGHSCVRVCYWLSDHLPQEALSSTIPLITLVDGGFSGAPRLTMQQYASAGGSIRDFFDLALHDHAVHAWPLSHERLCGESIYYQRLRGVAIKARNLLRALTPDAILVTHGAEPVSRAIAIESANLGIPVLWLESPFFPDFIALDVGTQHFFPQKSRLGRILPERLETPLTVIEETSVDRFIDDWMLGAVSKYKQVTAPEEQERLLQFVGDATLRTAFLPTQLSWDANVIPHLQHYPGVWEMYADVIRAMPDWKFVVKVHPMDIAGVAPQVAELENVLVVHDVSIHNVVKHSDLIVTVSSNVGLEALILGKPVVLLGRPFYANLGLSQDVTEIASLQEAAQRARPADARKVKRLVHALALEHLIPIGDAARLNSRLAEASAAGREIWSSVEILSPYYPQHANAYLEIARRYDQFARMNFCESEIRTELPELREVGDVAGCDTDIGHDGLPIDFGEVDIESLSRYAFAAAALYPGLRILHLDCGPGYGSTILAEQAAWVDAVNASVHEIAFARQSWGSERICYHAASVGRWLSTERDAYDAIVAFDTLEKVHDPHLFLSAAWTSLRPGGALILSMADSDAGPLTCETRSVRRLSLLELSDLLEGLPALDELIAMGQRGGLIGPKRPGNEGLIAIAVKSGGETCAVRSIRALVPFEMTHWPQRREWHIGAAQFSTKLGGKKIGGAIIFKPRYLEGHFVFGPYRKLPPGRHTVVFKLITAAGARSGNGKLTFEVVNANDQVLGRLALSGAELVVAQRVAVDFDHEQAAAPLEFRIHSSGAATSGDIIFNGVKVELNQSRDIATHASEETGVL